MNKGFTLFISLVVLAAMGLVMFSHIIGGQKTPRQPSPLVAEQGSGARQGGFATPLNAPQGDTGSLRSIEPPISSAGSDTTPPAQPPAANTGAPQPIRLTPPSDGKLAQPVTLPEPSSVNDGGTPSTEPSAATPAAPTTEKPDPAVTPSPETAPPQEKTTAPPPQAPTTTGSPTGSPGLTPWENPPQEPQTPQTTPQEPQATPQTTPQAPPTQAQNKPQTAQAPPSAGSHSLRTIALNPSGQSLVLQIEADSPFPCNAFALTGPDRLVVDLPGSWQGMRIPSIPENRLVKNARLGQQPAGPRLVLDLTGPIRHTIERSGNTARIIMQ